VLPLHAISGINPYNPSTNGLPRLLPGLILIGRRDIFKKQKKKKTIAEEEGTSSHYRLIPINKRLSYMSLIYHILRISQEENFKKLNIKSILHIVFLKCGQKMVT